MSQHLDKVTQYMADCLDAAYSMGLEKAPYVAAEVAQRMYGVIALMEEEIDDMVKEVEKELDLTLDHHELSLLLAYLENKGR